jgi:hypothetical protein
VVCLVDVLKKVGFLDPSPWCFSQKCGLSGPMRSWMVMLANIIGEVRAVVLLLVFIVLVLSV